MVSSRNYFEFDYNLALLYENYNYFIKNFRDSIKYFHDCGFNSNSIVAFIIFTIAFNCDLDDYHSFIKKVIRDLIRNKIIKNYVIKIRDYNSENIYDDLISLDNLAFAHSFIKGIIGSPMFIKIHQYIYCYVGHLIETDKLQFQEEKRGKAVNRNND